MTSLFRRRQDRVPPPVPPPPRTKVLVHPEVLQTIATASAAATVETGGPLFGTVHRSWDGTRLVPVACVLGTIAPGPDVRGRLASVRLGDGGDGDRAASALCWLREVTDLELLHLGDWHRHLWGMPEPSRGDHLTAKAMLAESAAPLWLAAVAVDRRAETEKNAAERHVVRHVRTESQTTDVRFYEASAAGLRPARVRIEAEALPTLPPLPWHLADPVRFAAECRLLDAAGFESAIDAGGQGTRLLLRVRRNGGRPLTIVTGPRYAGQEPIVFDERGRRVRSQTPWSPERFLVDLVREAAS